MTPPDEFNAVCSALQCRGVVDSLGKVEYRKRLAQVQGGEALRVASAYCTDSEPAVILIVGVIPFAFLAKKRKGIYMRRGEEPRELVTGKERQRTLSDGLEADGLRGSLALRWLAESEEWSD